MRITVSAAEAILKVMTKKGLDPKITFLEIAATNGSLGMSFTQDRIGKLLKIGELNVLIEPNIDTTGVVMDFGKIGDRSGLIFFGEENENHRQSNQ